MSRTVTLALLDGAGVPAGTLPPYEVPMPWWQEVSDVVAGARERYGAEVAVLRLLATDRPAPHGGAVTYLAQVSGPLPAALVPPALLPGAALPPGAARRSVRSVLAGHPLRAAWAVPGGPAASVAWAVRAARRLGLPSARAVQQRAWNLSAIWRLDAAPREGPGDDAAAPVAWLKQVPPFLGHEAAVLRWLAVAAPGGAPELLAAGERGRMLLAHVPGADWYDADLAGRLAIALDAHRLGLRAVPDVDALIGAGVPDRRAPRLARILPAVANRHGAGITGLADLLAGLPARLAAVRDCGLPDTLVHGDLHPGNVRARPPAAGRPAGRVLLDWGDSCIGHPAFDVLRLTEGLAPADAHEVIAAWAHRWAADLPGSDPVRAVALLRPVAALRAAAVYADFVANIEPTERPYHASDVPACLRRAVQEAAAS